MKRIVAIIAVLLIITGCNYRFTAKVYDESIESLVEKQESNLIDDKNKEIAISDLRLIMNDIIDDDNTRQLEGYFEKYIDMSTLEIQCIYYGSVEGDFIIIPKRELPEEYDFRERTPYQKAIVEDIYIAEPYLDILSNRMIQTICIKVTNEGEVEGVIGIDFFSSAEE